MRFPRSHFLRAGDPCKSICWRAVKQFLYTLLEVRTLTATLTHAVSASFRRASAPSCIVLKSTVSNGVSVRQVPRPCSSLSKGRVSKIVILLSGAQGTDQRQKHSNPLP